MMFLWRARAVVAEQQRRRLLATLEITKRMLRSKATREKEDPFRSRVMLGKV
jgi:hypothetical protein